MKAILIMVLLTATGRAVERVEVERLVKRAAEAEIPQWDPPWGYLEAREKLERMGEEGLVILREMAEDSTLCWQERLVARIVVERIERGEEIRALQFHKWGQYPEFRGEPDEWKNEIVPGSYRVGRMGPVVVRTMKEIGLWYYYIEQNWKTMRTKRECGYTWFASPEHPWPRWCRKALEGQSEEIYLWMAIADGIERGERLLDFYENQVLYTELYKRRFPFSVPALLKTPRLSREGLLGIMSWAGPEHAEALGQRIAEKEETFGDLRPRLEEVRKREPVKVQEPPFRCEKKPPLEGMKEPPPGFFDRPKPPEPPPTNTSPQDIIIHVN